MYFVGLLQAFLNSNSHGNGHTDHGGARRPPPVVEKGSRASGSGRQETSLLRQAKFLPGTATGGAMCFIATQIRNLLQAGCNHAMVGVKSGLRECGGHSAVLNYFRLSSTATATDTVIPTMGLLPAPRKPIISTWAGTEEEPANWASLCIRPMVSVMP